MRRNAQIYYFFIAVGIVLLTRIMFVFYTMSFVSVVRDVCVAVSLIAGSLPHVVSIPIRYCYYIRQTELVMLGVAIILFIYTFLEYIW